MLQSKAGYIDARPQPTARQNLLQRTAGPYIRATSELMQCSKPMLFDDLVGADKQCWRDD